MIPALFRGFFQLIRFAFNLSAPTKATQNLDEICQQLEVLQLDFSNAEAVSTACVYLVDPHKLPGSAKDAADNANGRESNADDGIPQHCFHYKRTSEQDQSDENYQVDDMSISSDSDFEETLQNHFQYTPGPKSGEKSDKNDDSFTDFVPSLKQQYVNDIISVSVAFTESFKSNTSFSRKGNPSLQNVTESISISSSRSPNSKRRKRRKTNNRFNGSSPVEQFSNSSLISSTPLSTKPDNERRRQVAVMNNAVKTKVRQSKHRVVLNLSRDSVDSMNAASFIDETRRREEGAIAKHIARIRTSSSRLNSNKEASPSLNNTSHYYSMRTSFGSNGSTSFI